MRVSLHCLNVCGREPSGMQVPPQGGGDLTLGDGYSLPLHSRDSQAVPTLTWCSCGQGILELRPGPLLISVLDLLTRASQFRAGKGQGRRSHHSGRASEAGAASPGTRQTSWRRGQCGGAHAVPTGLCFKQGARCLHGKGRELSPRSLYAAPKCRQEALSRGMT